jgi:hypothetical protein
MLRRARRQPRPLARAAEKERHAQLAHFDAGVELLLQEVHLPRRVSHCLPPGKRRRGANLVQQQDERRLGKQLVCADRCPELQAVVDSVYARVLLEELHVAGSQRAVSGNRRARPHLVERADRREEDDRGRCEGVSSETDVS